MNVSRPPQQRKVNYALYVKDNMPNISGGTASEATPISAFDRQKGKYSLKFSLDTVHIYGIIILTTDIMLIGDDHGRSHGCQSRGLERIRGIELAGRGSNRRVILSKRILRPTGPRVGQVRDASPRASRRSVRHTSVPSLRILPGGVLSGESCLREARAGRSDSQASRPQARPQAFGYNSGFYRSAPIHRQDPTSRGIGRDDSQAVQSVRPPTQHRTGLTTPTKKGAINSGQQDWSEDGWTCRYEDLRRAMIEEGTPAQSSWGLTLFLCQGLVAWMHAWPKTPAACENRDPHRLSGSPVALPERPPLWESQIILVLADMILKRSREVTT